MRLTVFQPVIPHYRVPLFQALADDGSVELVVRASQSVSGAPPSVAGLPHWADLEHPCLEFLGGSLFWQRRLQIAPEDRPGDVIVVSGNPRYLSNIPLLASARRRGLGVVWWSHLWSPTSRAWRARLRHSLMRTASVTLLYTEREVCELLKSEPGWSAPVFGLNNTIDTRPSLAAAAAWHEESLRDFCERHGIVDRNHLLLFCGRLRANPSTELHIALQALARLCEEDQTWRLAVIGSGEEAASLRVLAQQLKISGNVIWVGEIYDEADLAPWFLSAAVFIYPGAIGLALLHAFSYGLPVVTHSELTAHNPEIAAIRHDENGLLFERGNAEDLADKIARLGRDQCARQRLADNARHTVQGSFSFEHMVGRFMEAARVASRLSLETAGRAA